MRRGPSICDACARLRQRADPEALTSAGAWIPYCDAFPERVPGEIYVGGFDHRQPYEGDDGVRFEMRQGGERVLNAYEAFRALRRRRAERASDG
ncbi:hypothetical protein [Actinomadura roseirufa]|uniref:hypothetical protein n=1 Tax=Actinomadura roseirufa TaxID=2094049 RepID=UPI001041A415|nr:hypothetical protein [Actinomadura roseirufa]